MSKTRVSVLLPSELEKMLANQDMAFINEDITDLLSDQRRFAGCWNCKGLKLFSRVDSDYMQQHNINDCVRTTLAIVNNQLNICTVETHLGKVPTLPWM